MPFTIIRQDITEMKVDAIVNAANTGLVMGGGVCGAIFKAAGAKKLQAECDKHSPVKTGDAVLTKGFNLKSKYIIHAVGPIYERWDKEQSRQLLRAAYLNSLRIALAKDCRSIAFPLISSGIYGYPKEEALHVATEAVREFLAEHDMEVYLAVFDREAFAVSQDLLGAVKSYIDENYAEQRIENKRVLFRDGTDSVKGIPPMYSASESMSADMEFDDLISRLDEPFNITLLRLIDAKGKTDAQVYKRANIDRKLFSKIRIGKGYLPGKRTVLALAISLELSLSETDDLLERAGYALSHSQVFDVIVEYFIVSGNYDIYAINEVLFKYDQPLLGSC